MASYTNAKSTSSKGLSDTDKSPEMISPVHESTAVIVENDKAVKLLHDIDTNNTNESDVIHIIHLDNSIMKELDKNVVAEESKSDNGQTIVTEHVKNKLLKQHGTSPKLDYKFANDNEFKKTAVKGKPVEADSLKCTIERLHLDVADLKKALDGERSAGRALKAQFDLMVRQERAEFRKREHSLENQIKEVMKNKAGQSPKSDRHPCADRSRVNAQIETLKKVNKELSEKLQNVAEAERRAIAEMRKCEETRAVELQVSARAGRTQTAKLLEELKTKDRQIDQLKKSFKKVSGSHQKSISNLHRAIEDNHSDIGQMSEKARLHLLEAEIIRLEAELHSRNSIINQLKSTKTPERHNIQENSMTNRHRKELFIRDTMSDADSALSSGPSSLSPQPSPDAWESRNNELELEMAKKQIKELQKSVNEAALETGAAMSRAERSDAEACRLRNALRDARDHADLLEFRLLELDDGAVDKLGDTLQCIRDAISDADSGCVSPGNRINDSSSPEFNRGDSGYKSPVFSQTADSRSLSTPTLKRSSSEGHNSSEDIPKAFHSKDMHKNSKFEDLKNRLEAMLLSTENEEEKNCMGQILSLLWDLQSLNTSVRNDYFLKVNLHKLSEKYDKSDSLRDIESQGRSKIVATISPYSQKSSFKDDELNPEVLPKPKTEIDPPYSIIKYPKLLQESGIFEDIDCDTKETQTDFYEACNAESSGDLTTEIERLNEIREQLEKSGAIRSNSLKNDHFGDGDSSRFILSNNHKKFYERRLKLLEEKVLFYESTKDHRDIKLAELFHRESVLECQIQDLNSQLDKLQTKYTSLEEECCELDEAENDTRLHCQQLEIDYELVSAQLRDMEEQRDSAKTQTANMELVVHEYEEVNVRLLQQEQDLRERLEAIESTMPALIFWNVFKIVEANPKFDFKAALTARFGECPPPVQRAQDSIPIVDCKGQRACRALLAYQNVHEGNLAGDIRGLESHLQKLLEEREMVHVQYRQTEDCLRSQICELECLLQQSALSAQKMEEETNERISALEHELSTSKKKASDPLNQALKQIEEGQTFDNECMLRLQQLVQSENDLKARIRELEHREMAYLETLTQADDMWADMESGYKAQIKSKQDQEDKLKEEMQKCQCDMEKWKNLCEPLQQRVRELEDEESCLQAELKSSLGHVHRLNEQGDKLKIKLEDLTSEATALALKLTSEMATMQVELETARRKSQKLIEELDDVRRQSKETEKMFNDEIEEARKEIADTCKELVELDLTNSELKEEVDTLEKQVSTLNEAMREQRTSFDEQLKSLSQELRRKSKEVDDMTMGQKASSALNQELGLAGIKGELNKLRTEGGSDIFHDCECPSNLTSVVKEASQPTKKRYKPCSCPSVKSKLVEELTIDMFDKMFEKIDERSDPELRETNKEIWEDAKTEMKRNLRKSLTALEEDGVMETLKILNNRKKFSDRSKYKSSLHGSKQPSDESVYTTDIGEDAKHIGLHGKKVSKYEKHTGKDSEHSRGSDGSIESEHETHLHRSNDPKHKMHSYGSKGFEREQYSNESNESQAITHLGESKQETYSNGSQDSEYGGKKSQPKLHRNNKRTEESEYESNEYSYCYASEDLAIEVCKYAICLTLSMTCKNPEAQTPELRNEIEKLQEVIKELKNKVTLSMNEIATIEEQLTASLEKLTTCELCSKQPAELIHEPLVKLREVLSKQMDDSDKSEASMVSYRTTHDDQILDEELTEADLAKSITPKLSDDFKSSAVAGEGDKAQRTQMGRSIDTISPSSKDVPAMDHAKNATGVQTELRGATGEIVLKIVQPKLSSDSLTCTICSECLCRRDKNNFLKIRKQQKESDIERNAAGLLNKNVFDTQPFQTSFKVQDLSQTFKSTDKIKLHVEPDQKQHEVVAEIKPSVQLQRDLPQIKSEEKENAVIDKISLSGELKSKVGSETVPFEKIQKDLPQVQKQPKVGSEIKSSENLFETTPQVTSELKQLSSTEEESPEIGSLKNGDQVSLLKEEVTMLKSSASLFEKEVDLTEERTTRTSLKEIEPRKELSSEEKALGIGDRVATMQTAIASRENLVIKPSQNIVKIDIPIDVKESRKKISVTGFDSATKAVETGIDQIDSKLSKLSQDKYGKTITLVIKSSELSQRESSLIESNLGVAKEESTIKGEVGIDTERNISIENVKKTGDFGEDAVNVLGDGIHFESGKVQEIVSKLDLIPGPCTYLKTVPPLPIEVLLRKPSPPPPLPKDTVSALSPPLPPLPPLPIDDVFSLLPIFPSKEVKESHPELSATPQISSEFEEADDVEDIKSLNMVELTQAVKDDEIAQTQSILVKADKLHQPTHINSTADNDQMLLNMARLSREDSTSERQKFKKFSKILVVKLAKQPDPMCTCDPCMCTNCKLPKVVKSGGDMVKDVCTCDVCECLQCKLKTSKTAKVKPCPKIGCTCVNCECPKVTKTDNFDCTCVSCECQFCHQKAKRPPKILDIQTKQKTRQFVDSDKRDAKTTGQPSSSKDDEFSYEKCSNSTCPHKLKSEKKKLNAPCTCGQCECGNCQQMNATDDIGEKNKSNLECVCKVCKCTKCYALMKSKKDIKSHMDSESLKYAQSGDISHPPGCKCDICVSTKSTAITPVESHISKKHKISKHDKASFHSYYKEEKCDCVLCKCAKTSPEQSSIRPIKGIDVPQVQPKSNNSLVCPDCSSLAAHKYAKFCACQQCQCPSCLQLIAAPDDPCKCDLNGSDSIKEKAIEKIQTIESNIPLASLTEQSTKCDKFDVDLWVRDCNCGKSECNSCSGRLQIKKTNVTYEDMASKEAAEIGWVRNKDETCFRKEYFDVKKSQPDEDEELCVKKDEGVDSEKATDWVRDQTTDCICSECQCVTCKHTSGNMAARVEPKENIQNQVLLKDKPENCKCDTDEELKTTTADTMEWSRKKQDLCLCQACICTESTTKPLNVIKCSCGRCSCIFCSRKKETDTGLPAFVCDCKTCKCISCMKKVNLSNFRPGDCYCPTALDDMFKDKNKDDGKMRCTCPDCTCNMCKYKKKNATSASTNLDQQRRIVACLPKKKCPADVTPDKPSDTVNCPQGTNSAVNGSTMRSSRILCWKPLTTSNKSPTQDPEDKKSSP